MAKQNMIDTAKELETKAQSLFERIKRTQDALGETLNAIRGAEGRLTEKEQQAAKERAEERLRQKESIREYYHSKAALARAMARLKTRR